MTLQQLKYAVTVAECGTISAAAEKLFISSPALPLPYGNWNRRWV